MTSRKVDDPALAVFQEIQRLTDAGFNLLPLGGDAGGKSPLVRFKNQEIGLNRVRAIMASKSSYLYGVRMAGLAVADLDQRSEELFDIVTERCGPSPFRSIRRAGVISISPTQTMCV